LGRDDFTIRRLILIQMPSRADGKEDGLGVIDSLHEGLHNRAKFRVKSKLALVLVYALLWLAYIAIHAFENWPLPL
jgi:hypothetical protein